MRAECIASHLGLTKHGSDGAGGTMHGRRAPADAASRRLCRSGSRRRLQVRRQGPRSAQRWERREACAAGRLGAASACAGTVHGAAVGFKLSRAPHGPASHALAAGRNVGNCGLGVQTALWSGCPAPRPPMPVPNRVVGLLVDYAAWSAPVVTSRGRCRCCASAWAWKKLRNNLRDFEGDFNSIFHYILDSNV